MNRGLAGCLVVGGVLVLILVIAGMSLAGSTTTLVAQDQQVRRLGAVQNVLQRRAACSNLSRRSRGTRPTRRRSSRPCEARGRLAARPRRASRQANAALSSALNRLIAIAENYPNLSQREFHPASGELAGTENRIRGREGCVQRRGPGLQHRHQALPHQPVARLFASPKRNTSMPSPARRKSRR